MKVIKSLNIKGKKVFSALITGLLLLLMSYKLSDLPLFTGEDISTLSVLQWLKEKVTATAVDEDLSEAIFINTSHDKMLTDLYESGRLIGNTDITNRYKLLDLLKHLDSIPYRYIILDIRFEKGYDTDADSALFGQIGQMKNIVLPLHKNIQMHDGLPIEKCAMADFNSTIVSTNFSHYHFVTEAGPSMPTYAYQELTNQTITRHWGYYTSQDQLCQKSGFLQFSTEAFSYHKSDGDFRYYNLGADLLDNQYLDLYNTLKGKIVVIGNFEEDTHDTYAGKKPGSLIVYRALTTLINGGHTLPFWYLFVQFMLYTIISYTIFTKQSLIDRIPYFRNHKHPFANFVVSAIGYSTVLMAASIVLFVMFDKVLSIVWISLIFSLIKNIITHKAKHA